MRPDRGPVISRRMQGCQGKCLCTKQLHVKGILDPVVALRNMSAKHGKTVRIDACHKRKPAIHFRFQSMVSHKMAVPSWLPVSTDLPSGANATEVTSCEWPLSVRTS